MVHGLAGGAAASHKEISSPLHCSRFPTSFAPKIEFDVEFTKITCLLGWFGLDSLGHARIVPSYMGFSLAINAGVALWAIARTSR